MLVAALPVDQCQILIEKKCFDVDTSSPLHVFFYHVEWKYIKWLRQIIAATFSKIKFGSISHNEIKKFYWLPLSSEHVS